MIKPMSVIRICVVTFAVFLLCSCATHKTIIREGNSELRITIENGQLTEEMCTGNIGVIKKCFEGKTENLILVDTKGTPVESDDVHAKILTISDHTTIRVAPGTAGGHCSVYLWSGRWWEVCD